MDMACRHRPDDILVIKHASDTRYGLQNVLFTHSSKTLPCVVAKRLQDVYDHPAYKSIAYIFVDEGQFFDDLVDFCRVACEKDGKHIHVAALNGDANRSPFPNIADVLPLVDTTETLYAKCVRCTESCESVNALFSYRKSATLDDTSAVGASEQIRSAVPLSLYRNQRAP
jgi:thymidine kinase